MLRNVIGHAQGFLANSGDQLPKEVDRILNNVREEVKKDTGDDMGPPPPGEAVVSQLTNIVDVAE